MTTTGTPTPRPVPLHPAEAVVPLLDRWATYQRRGWGHLVREAEATMTTQGRPRPDAIMSDTPRAEAVATVAWWTDLLALIDTAARPLGVEV